MKLLEDFYQVTKYVLPTFEIILLILLIIAVFKVIKILKGVDGTVGKVNTSLDEIQKPIATVVKISGGVDAVYDYSEKAMKGLGLKIVEVLNYLKALITGSLNKEEQKEEEQCQKPKKVQTSQPKKSKKK